jgi:D-inositol-3-phosphate glycosyltransferase
MNVYVRELASSLAQAGVACTVYVRRWDRDGPDVVDVEPGFRVVHVEAGPPALAKEMLPEIVDEFTDRVLASVLAAGDFDALHANYWLSGIAAHRIKHELGLPLVCTFHTLARVKAETGDPEPQRRIEAEAEVIRCADAILANSASEAGQLVELYGAPADRIEIVPPGVDHAFFSPGDRGGARRALGLDPHRPTLLFAGRIQPLKGLPVAVSALAELGDPAAQLVVVGGPSGVGGEAELEASLALARRLGVRDQLILVDPQPHHLLSTFYRAADVCVVPSRSESFGLVALEAAACGTPVVAAAVGGLLTLVEDGSTGLLVDGRDPVDYARHIRSILDDPELARDMSAAAAELAGGFTWSTTAARLRRLYADLSVRSPIECLLA